MLLASENNISEGNEVYFFPVSYLAQKKISAKSVLLL